jgi:hypothetical protein
MKSEREAEHQRAKRHNYGKIAIACLPTFVSQDSMAIALDQSASGANGSATFSHAANALVIVATVDFSQSANAPTGATISGVAMTALPSTPVGSGNAYGNLYAWYLFRTSSESNVTVTIQSGGYPMIVFSLTGTATSAPFFEDEATSTTASSGVQSVSVSAGTSGRMIIALASAANYSTGNPSYVMSYTDGSGLTRIAAEITNTNNGGDNPSYQSYGVVASYDNSSDSLTTTETYSTGAGGTWYQGMLSIGVLPLPGAATNNPIEVVTMKFNPIMFYPV